MKNYLTDLSLSVLSLASVLLGCLLRGDQTTDVNCFRIFAVAQYVWLLSLLTLLNLLTGCLTVTSIKRYGIVLSPNTNATF